MGGVMKIDVKNWDNEVVGSIDLPEEVFAREVNQHLVWEVVRAYLASRRRGTHKTKVRSEVRGSGRKLWRQKGTGRARRGNIKSPLLRGGGVIFGPDGRTYAYKVPKKVRRLALKMALSSKLADQQLVVVDQFGLEKIKTIGDAYMVASGIPVPREDHAQVLARFALAARDELAEHNLTADVPVEFRLRVDDYGESQRGSDRYDRELLVQPGINRIEIPLSEIREGPSSRTLDMTRIRRMILYANRPSSPVSVYIDGFRLE